MARWRLTAKHYLRVPGTEWNYKEHDRMTGRPKNTKFEVPLLLDPEAATDWNYRTPDGEGEIVVAYHESDAFPRDIIFVGEPTPDMFPLDDEAKALSAAFKVKWSGQMSDGRIHDDNMGGHTKFLLDHLTAQVADIQSATQQSATTGMTELLTAMAAMMKQNQEMMAMLAKGATQAPVARRA